MNCLATRVTKKMIGNKKLNMATAALLASSAVLPAATPVIGVALSNGNISINNNRTAGNANLYDGNTIETSESASRVELKDGARVQLATDSRGTIYHDHLLLEKGTTQFLISDSYMVNANTLRISAVEPNTSARISIHGPVVEVASLTGTVRVSNKAGEVVANLAPGKAFDFTPQDAGAAAPPSNGKKKKAAGAAPGAGAAGAGAGAGTTAGVVAGVVVAAAVGTTVGIVTTQGEANPPATTISPTTR